MVLALNQLFRALRHVVSEIIKSEFVVRAVRDVSAIRFSSLLTVWLMLVNAVNAHAMKFKNWRHPL